MNKNVIIWILVAVVVVAGGYYLFTNNQNPSVTNQYNTTVTPNPNTPVVPETPTPSPSLTLGTPRAETSSNSSTSISTALVNGQVTPNGVLTTYWFDYGETQSLGSKTAAQQVGSGFSAISAPQYITGLKASTTYYYRLSANNNFGTISGNVYTFQTNNTPPPKAAKPTARTSNASAITRTTANLNGEVTPNGWQTSYWFEYGKDGNFGNTTTINTTSGSLSATSTVVGSIATLDPLTKYYFRLNAQNQFGTVNGTTLSFTTQGPLNPGVPTVTTSQSSSITGTGAKLNGSINPNGADTTYWFEYGNDPLISNPIGSGTTTQTITAGTKSVSVEANVASLTKNTKYYYRLVGKNQYGTINGSIDSFTTKNQ